MGLGQLLLLALSRLATAIGLTSAVLSLAQSIYNALHPGGAPFDFNALAGDVQFIKLIVGDPGYGLFAIRAEQNADETAILAAIAGRQSGTTAVILPTTPPAGYGGLTGSQTGDAVWLYNTGFPSGNALGALAEIRYTAVEMGDGYTAFPTSDAAPWWISGPFYDPRFDPSPRSSVIALDFTTILPTDATANAWCRRVYPAASWEIPVHGTCVLQGADGFFYSLPWLTPTEFARIQAALVPVISTTAPVWPGLAKVTLLTSHALATGLTITAPMDGAIVAITAVPPGTGLYDFDGTLSYTFVGALSFVSDNGDQEFPQSIGFQSAVYSPREMVRATGVKVRAKLGVVGTVTPWRIT